MPVADAVENPILYDTTLYLWRTIINIFFREIRPRGSHNIPTDGAVIFVGAPHHNQFLDPVLLVSEAYKTAGRRPAFLIAAKSMTRRLIGTFAAAMGSIPVVRSADMAKKGTGNIALSLEDPCLVIGYGTKFTEELAPRKQIMLSKSLGFATAEVVEVISDTEVRVKKEFEDDGGKKTARFRELAQQEKVLTGKDGLAFKVLPHLDQSEMYQHVYKRLMDGGSIGIFPEGGSHDRTDLLPLKAGVSIMALGAMAANPTLRVRIVPVGLSYFHAHKFRSRAVVEFGAPMEVPREYVDMFSHGGGDKRAAISGLLDMIYDALKTVTLRAPDYETLMLVQAGRRLYRTPGRHLTLSQTVELNKRFINGYMHFKDEPRVKALMDEVLRYNRRLRDLGLKDHQVPSARKANWKTLGLLTYRVGLLSVWTLFALPGVIINSPVFILTKVLSRKKQREALAASTVKIAARDVVASWKVIIALGFTPFLYSFYAMAATAVVWRAGAPLKWRIWTPFLVSCALPLVGFSALKFGEAGMDVLKSLRPLIVSLIPGQQRELERLKQWRRELSTEMTDVINEYGPKIYDDFDDIRLLRPSSSAPPSDSGIRRKQTAAAGVDSQSSLLAHPMTWLDERLFGWSKSGRRGNSNWAGQSKSTEPSRAPTPAGSDDEEETGDYDEAVGYLGRYDDSGRKRSRSLQQSYADLQQLKAKSQQGSPTAYSSALPGGEVRRARKGSLTDSVEVKRLAELDPDETFKEATDEVNAENNLPFLE